MVLALQELVQSSGPLKLGAGVLRLGKTIKQDQKSRL